VIHVTDWERSNAFDVDVMGAELVARPVGYAYRFGDQQLFSAKGVDQRFFPRPGWLADGIHVLCGT
jgi:catechol 2,3-dioxygenase-like lactoylglutathione lyase family enzyme